MDPEHQSYSDSSRSPYYRMNSEVVEKPSHFEHSDPEEILAILSSPENSPCEQEIEVLEYGSHSPCSSSKADGKKTYIMPRINSMCNMNEASKQDDMFQFGCFFDDIDSVLSAEGQGDELDEGFDEEFEFFDNDEVKDTSNNPNDIDINDTDLQRILIEQSANLPLSNVLLDDFDLGVVEFDSFLSLDKPPINKPSSPYPQYVQSPVSVATGDVSAMQSDSTFNNVSSFYSMPSSLINLEQFNPCPNSNITSTQMGASWCNPTLSSVTLDGIDLNEASQIMTTNLMTPADSYMTTPTSPHTPVSTISEVRSPTPSTTRTARSLSPAPSYSYNPPTTPLNQVAYCVPSPAESSQSGASVFSNMSFNGLTSNPDLSGMDDQQIIDMSFHKFKKILDDTTVSEREKERLKNMRRKGKNKVAAKNCRQKKLTMICGLQQEIDEMKSAKARLNMKTRSLEQEITRLKQVCAHRYKARSVR